MAKCPECNKSFKKSPNTIPKLSICSKCYNKKMKNAKSDFFDGF